MNDINLMYKLRQVYQKACELEVCLNYFEKVKGKENILFKNIALKWDIYNAVIDIKQLVSDMDLDSIKNMLEIDE